MRQIAAARIVTALLAVVTMIPGSASAQRRAPAREPGDKTRGEEEEIRKREEWFIQSRGLATVARPDRLRAEAVQDLARRQALRADELKAAGQSWQSVGPLSMTMMSWAMGRVAGRSVSLAVHPADENILYLGTASGGLWKTIDGGSNWTSIFDGVGTQSVGAVTLQASDPNVVWVGTGERQSSCVEYFGLGIFRSTDGGASFQARNGSGTTALELSYVNSIAIHPTSPNTLLVAGEAFCLPDGTRVGGGVFKTTDGGASWVRVKSGTGSDVLYDPVDPTVAYLAMSGQGIFKSTNGGDTWTPASTSISGSRIRLAMAPSDPQILYALTSSSQLHRTSNGAATWTQVNSAACGGQCSYNLILDVHPTDPDQLLVGTILWATSTNGGPNLSTQDASWGPSQKVHQDLHIIRFSRSSVGKFWVGGDGGLWRTDSSGFNFINLNSNLNLTQFYDVTVDPDDPMKVFGGAQDNSSSGRFNSQLWNVTVVTGDGFMNVIDPANTTRVFQTSYPSGGTPSVYRSLSGGTPGSYNRLTTFGIGVGEPFPWVTPLAILPGTVFVGSNFVYRGTTTQPVSSFTWKKISPDLAGGAPLVVIHPYGPSRVPDPRAVTYGAYAGSSNGRIQRAFDLLGATTWTDVTSNYPGGYVSDIATDPDDPARVYVTRGAFNQSRLYRSANGGMAWDPVGIGLPNVPANAVAVDPTDGRRVFVGNDVGVYESIDYGATFQPFSLDLPLGSVVTDLEIDDNPYVLVAGTYGRGAWRVNLIPVPNAPPDAQFAETAAGLVVGFEDRSSDPDGKIASWLWSFGDGTVSTERSPVKTYAVAGSYAVTLTVTDDRAASASRSSQVTVSDAAPRRSIR